VKRIVDSMFNPTLMMAVVGRTIALPNACLADQSDLKLDNKVYLKEVVCEFGIAPDGSFWIDQGNYLTIRIREGMFHWNGSNPPSSSPNDPNKYKLRPIEHVTASYSKKRFCWQSQRINLCASLSE
jgi:hypothetical protein